MTQTLPDLPETPLPAEDRRELVVIPRIHDASGARTRYGFVPATTGTRDALQLPVGPVDDPEQLRAGAALLLARTIGAGMSAAVIAPLGRLYADEHQEHRIDVMLAVARQHGPEDGETPELERGPVRWLSEAELLRAITSGQVVDTTTCAAIALLLACGELVR